MQDFITILFFITTCILFCILLFKKQKINEINNNIQEENKKLEIDKQIKIAEIKNFDHQIEEKKIALKAVEDITNNMNAAAHAAYDQYHDSLNKEYYLTESEYDEAITELQESYNIIQDNLIIAMDKTKKELEKLESTRAAALEAVLKEQSIKDKQSFYCPQVPEDELKDARTLRDIEYKLNNPRVLRMLI